MNTQTSNISLRTLYFSEVKTYLWAAVFVVCNMALPQLFHLIPQGGIIFSPLSLVILVGAYKFGWRTGLLAAVASPLVNNLVFGMPAWGVMPLMAFKLAVLALVAGFTAQHYRKVSVPLLIGVVLVTKFIGGLAELLTTGAVAATAADFTTGWPGLLLMVFGGYAVIRYTK